MIVTKWLEFETEIGDVKEITEHVSEAVLGSGLEEGIATVFVPGATGAINHPGARGGPGEGSRGRPGAARS